MSLPLCVLGERRHKGLLSFLETTSFHALMQPDVEPVLGCINSAPARALLIRHILPLTMVG